MEHFIGKFAGNQPFLVQKIFSTKCQCYTPGLCPKMLYVFYDKVQ